MIDAFDAVITAAVFDQEISLLFEEDSWSHYFFSGDNKEGHQKIINKKLLAIAAMDNIDIYIASDKISKINARSHTNTNHLLHFFQTIFRNSSSIEKKSTPALIQECDTILSF